MLETDAISEVYVTATEFEKCCCHLNFRYRACLEQGVPWHLSYNRV